MAEETEIRLGWKNNNNGEGETTTHDNKERDGRRRAMKVMRVKYGSLPPCLLCLCV